MKVRKMRKETDMKGVKDIAKVFLHMDLEKTKFSPLVIMHAFTDSAMVCLMQSSGEPAVVNIVENTEMFAAWKNQVEKHIESAENVFDVYHLITKSYLLAFLKFVKAYLSVEDFSKLFANTWVRTEYPNLDPNFSQKELLQLFRQSKQEELMTEEELETLRKLPDTVLIFRGVTTYNANKVKALSWTLDQTIAKWFANRFGENGTVYRAEISKENILALFQGRGENEVIVDPNHLVHLSKAEE